MELALTIFYIIPAILSVFVIIHKQNEVTVLDLIFIVLASLLPIVNMFAGYVCGLISLCESKRVNNFLNKRIK
jgi:hypothetical protein